MDPFQSTIRRWCFGTAVVSPVLTPRPRLLISREQFPHCWLTFVTRRHWQNEKGRNARPAPRGLCLPSSFGYARACTKCTRRRRVFEGNNFEVMWLVRVILEHLLEQPKAYFWAVKSTGTHFIFSSARISCWDSCIYVYFTSLLLCNLWMASTARQAWLPS